MKHLKLKHYNDSNIELDFLMGINSLKFYNQMYNSPTYFTSSKAFLAFLSSSFIVRRSLTRAYFRASLRTKKIMSSTWTLPVLPTSIALLYIFLVLYYLNLGLHEFMSPPGVMWYTEWNTNMNIKKNKNIEVFSRHKKVFFLSYLCVVSVINSITKSSKKSTLSVYGFWSSPNPYIIHLNSLLKSLLRPDVVPPNCCSSSSSNYKAILLCTQKNKKINKQRKINSFTWSKLSCESGVGVAMILIY